MKNPLIPMGAITGNPTKEHIEVALHSYSEKGIQQFLIYPRSGCEIEYMSERWIEVCGYIIETAARENIDIWLYDEFNWPSGSCNGKIVQENPGFCSSRVIIKDGKCIVDMNKNYVDILNPDATDCFIKNTHEIYYKHFGIFFGNVIKGFFTDEPDFSYCSWNGGNYPYTRNLDTIYQEKYGFDLFQEMLNPTPEFNTRYWTLLGEMYRKNYIDRLNIWCLDHNIVLTGHTMDEINIHEAAVTCGNTIKSLRGFSLPGIDDIFTKTSIETAEWLTLGCGEAAIKAVGNGGLAELFALGPTDIVPARVEQMIWLVSLFGVDHYVLAVSALDARGNYIKNDYYNPMNYTSPWFEGYGELGKTAIRAAEVASKNPTAEIAIRYPASLAIKHLKTDKEEMINERLYAVMQELVRNQYQWRLIDEDESAEHYAYLIEITDSGDFSADKIIEDIKTKIPQKIYVLENGNLADQLMLKKFDGGSFVILDLCDKDEARNLVLCCDGKETPIKLPGRGHYISGDPIPTDSELVSVIDTDFVLKLSKANSLRCNFDNLKFTFTVSEEIKNVYLAVRNYYYDGEITINSIKLTPKNPCSYLSKGIDELYSCTDKFTLTPGEYTVKTSIDTKDVYFLPTCFICGNFAADKNNVLRNLPQTVPAEGLEQSTLPQYSGIISFEADIDVPALPCMIEFDSSQLYTQVYINGCSLGGRLADYKWEIPEEFQKATVKLRIEQYTSIGPIFGIANKALRRIPGDYQKCGIKNVRFTQKNDR